MCGISGFIGVGDRDDLSRMVDSLSHRGPDGAGHQSFPDHAVFLGHRRLSIIDITDGHQPMANEDRTVWVTFNGEIYNHAALRKELQSLGHVFSTDHSDTEVLVHGWEEWKEALPEKLNGMFAFAIWDSSERTLFLARDRFGEKPLYWGEQNGLFLFASELSAFLQHSHFSAKINDLSLKKYFAYGFIPAPNALHCNTHKLPPGHWFKRNADGSQRCEAYFQFRIEPSITPPSLDEAAEEIRSLFMQSVKRRLMSDVPYGVFLSGGVDSSSTAAAMCSLHSPESVKSFSIGFNEPSFDETAYARSMAASLGCAHAEEVLDFDTAMNLMDTVLGKIDEPLADASILPTYLLCRFAHTQIKVALSGDGGDELFAGYDPFVALLPAQIYHAVVPRIAHKGLCRLSELLPKSTANMSFDFKVRRALQGLDYGPELWNPAWLSPMKASDLNEIFNEPVEVEDLYAEALALWNRTDDLSIVDKTLEFYSVYYLPDDILTKVDRASMMNGLEVRSVFLDPELVDFVRTLPSQYKFDGRTRKLVLKKALAGLVPQSILERPKKGFGIPLASWMRNAVTKPKMAMAFEMRPNSVHRLMEEHRTGIKDHRLFMWAWICLERFAGAVCR